MQRNRKNRSRKRKPAVRTGRRTAPPVLKSAVILVVAIIFILIIIPFTITMVFTSDSQEGTKKENRDPGAQPEETITDTAAVPKTIRVQREDSGKREKIEFEEYVKGVVASEMPSDFEEEALKAQAVAARTYSLAKVQNAKKNGNSSTHPKAPVCDTVHCQVYQDKAQLKKGKGADWMRSDWEKISAAVEDTKGQLLYYDGQLVQQALFHSSSGGKTENCEDVFASAVPYLVSVESPYEEDATHKKETLTLSLSEFSAKIKASYPDISFGTITSGGIKILSRSSGGRVDQMRIGNGTVTGKHVREALGLYSANFTISTGKDTITFTTTGSGHGVGMSQYGANGMAKEGYSYKEILQHYYSGTTIAGGS